MDVPYLYRRGIKIMCNCNGGSTPPPAQLNYEGYVAPMEQVFEEQILLDQSSYIVNTSDLPDENGFHYRYSIAYKRNNAPGVILHAINFQRGAIEEVGANGLTDKILLQVVQDRLKNSGLEHMSLQGLIDILP